MLSVCKLNLLLNSKEYLDDEVIRIKANEVLSYMGNDRHYAEVLFLNLKHIYIKTKYPELYKKIS